MKWNFHNVSIQAKLMFVMLTIAFITLFLIVVSTTLLEIRNKRQLAVEDLSSLADVVSWNSSAALIFNDKKTAVETLSALKTKAEIISATIYNENGQIFGSYSSDTSNIEESYLQEISEINAEAASIVSEVLNGKKIVDYHERHNHLFLAQPVIFEGDIIGAIVLVDDMSKLRSALKKQYASVFLIMLFTLGVVLLFSAFLQRLLSQPIKKIVDVMRDVSNNADYTIKVKKTSNDEIGELVDVFNTMLDEIQQRENQLEKKSGELEQKVAVRTNELSEVNEQLKKTLDSLKKAKEMAYSAINAKSVFLANMIH